MITGIGVDIIDIERFRTSIERFGDRLLTKIFTDDEIRYCSSRLYPAKHFASRFAAKEALSKSLATGNSGIFRWKSVEIFSLSNGRPALQFHHVLAERLTPDNFHLSISMSERHVVAFVIMHDRRAPK